MKKILETRKVSGSGNWKHDTFSFGLLWTKCRLTLTSRSLILPIVDKWAQNEDFLHSSAYQKPLCDVVVILGVESEPREECCLWRPHIITAKYRYQTNKQNPLLWTKCRLSLTSRSLILPIVAKWADNVGCSFLCFDTPFIWPILFINVTKLITPRSQT
jgi:hypothetical protein